MRYPRLFEKNQCDFQGLFVNPEGAGYQTYESNIVFPLRFMIDTGVLGMNWIKCLKGKYTILTGKEKVSHCQIELRMECVAAL